MITEGFKLIQISVFLVFTKINPALFRETTTALNFTPKNIIH